MKNRRHRVGTVKLIKQSETDRTLDYYILTYKCFGKTHKEIFKTTQAALDHMVVKAGGSVGLLPNAGDKKYRLSDLKDFGGQKHD